MGKQEIMERLIKSLNATVTIIFTLGTNPMRSISNLNAAADSIAEMLL